MTVRPIYCMHQALQVKRKATSEKQIHQVKSNDTASPQCWVKHLMLNI